MLLSFKKTPLSISPYEILNKNHNISYAHISVNIAVIYSTVVLVKYTRYIFALETELLKVI